MSKMCGLPGCSQPAAEGWRVCKGHTGLEQFIAPPHLGDPSCLVARGSTGPSTLLPAQPYPDGNPKSVQGAKKHSLKYSPTAALIHMNGAFADGAAKYGPANWREKGVAASVYIDAALRHMSLYFDGGEQVASDSKVHHLGHAMACLAIILDAEAAGTLTDDRPIPMPNLEALLKRS